MYILARIYEKHYNTKCASIRSNLTRKFHSYNVRQSYRAVDGYYLGKKLPEHLIFDSYWKAFDIYETLRFKDEFQIFEYNPASAQFTPILVRPLAKLTILIEEEEIP